MVQDRCTNLKTVTISAPNIKSSDIEAVFRLAAGHFNEDITIKNNIIEVNADPQSSNTNTSYMEAKTRIFESFLNPDSSRGCHRLGSCNTHEHILDWISQSAMEPCSFLLICLRVLDHANDIAEPLMPNGRTTRISANGKLCSIQWKAFTMRVFCDPAPTTALQATLALILHEMSSNTEFRSESLAYGKFAPPSQVVFSRRDIRSTFDQARVLNLKEVKERVKSIRILNFMDERIELEEDESKTVKRKRKRKSHQRDDFGGGPLRTMRSRESKSARTLKLP